MNWNGPAFATCLAILYLNKCLSSKKHQWELAAKKSERWLGKYFPVVCDDEAEQFFESFCKFSILSHLKTPHCRCLCSFK